MSISSKSRISAMTRYSCNPATSSRAASRIRPHGQPAAAAEIGRRPDCLVLRGGRPLDDAWPRRCQEFLGRVSFRPVARAQAGDEGAHAGGAAARWIEHGSIAATRVRRGSRDRRATAAGVGQRARDESKLTGSLGAQVRSAQSASSLQLALENEKLMDAQRSYVKALKVGVKLSRTSLDLSLPSTARSTAPMSIRRTVCSEKCGASS